MPDAPKSPFSPLDRLRRWRGQRRRRSPALVTALDVDGQTLRVAQAVPRGNRLVVTRVTAAALDLPAEADRSDPTTLGRAIARALAGLDLKPATVVMGVPRAQVVLRTLTLPAIEDIRQLASMVHFQISRDLPFRLDDAVVDFKVRSSMPAAEPAPDPGAREPGGGSPKPEAAGGRVEVLVAAARREVAEFYQQAAESAGVKLAALGLLSYANVRCVEACQVAEDDQLFALISLRPDEVNIDVIARQSLLFSRGAAVKAPPEPAPGAAEPATSDRPGSPALPGADATRRAAFADAVTIEVVRSLHSYSGMDPGNAAAKVVVAGATGHEAAVVEALGKRLSIPCTVLDPAAALDLPAPAREHAPGSIAVIGLALGLSGSEGLPFDFLHPKHPAVPRDLRRIRVLVSIATAAAVLIFVMAIRGYLLNRLEKVRRELDAELFDAEKKSPTYRRLIQQTATVEDWEREGRNWLDQYAYLSAVLPPSEEIYVTSINVSGQGTIRLNVQAQSGEILAKLEKQLRAVGYDVKPLAITPGADRHGYEFRSTVELWATDKLKVNLSAVKAPGRPADDASLDPAVNKDKGGGG